MQNGHVIRILGSVAVGWGGRTWRTSLDHFQESDGLWERPGRGTVSIGGKTEQATG